MEATRTFRLSLTALSIAAALAACGGGGGDAAAPTADASAVPATLPSTDGQPVAAITGGDFSADPAPATLPDEKVVGSAACPAPSDGVIFTSTQGFAWDLQTQRNAAFALANHARCMAGVPTLTREARIDTAATSHARYLVLNNIDGHYQDATKTGFTGVTPGNRLTAAGYPFTTWGEVMSRSSPLATESIDGLITAIYHRITMLNSAFTHAGVGIERDSAGRAVAVVDYGSTTRATKTQRLAVYPASGQTEVLTTFDTNSEYPDPSAELGVAGYPVSVQADAGAVLTLDRFELVRASDGAKVDAIVRGTASTGVTGITADANLPRHAAFLLPRAALAAGTEYEVRFNGRVDGTAQARTWRFRTKPASALAVPDKSTLAVGEFIRVKLDGCSARYSWSWTGNVQPSLWSSGWMQVKGVRAGTGYVDVRDGCGRTQRVNLTVR